MNNISKAYYALYHYTARLDLSNAHKSIPHLPAQLVVPPGIYQYKNTSIDLRKEGVYRLIDSQGKAIQRVVYHSDLQALLSSLSWITSHNNHDNNLSFRQLYDKATQSKLLLTCGYNSFFCRNLLTALGYKAFSVAAAYLTSSNQFDSHTILEVYDPARSQWSVYDLDLNVSITKKGVPIPFADLINGINNDEDIHFEHFTASTTMATCPSLHATKADAIDILSSEEYTSVNGVELFYKTTMKLPLWFDESIGCWVFTDHLNKDKIMTINPNYVYISTSEFAQRFGQKPIDSYLHLD